MAGSPSPLHPVTATKAAHLYANRYRQPGSAGRRKIGARASSGSCQRDVRPLLARLLTTTALQGGSRVHHRIRMSGFAPNLLSLLKPEPVLRQHCQCWDSDPVINGDRSSLNRDNDPNDNTSGRGSIGALARAAAAAWRRLQPGSSAWAIAPC